MLVGPTPGSTWHVADASLRGESAAHHSTLRYALQDGRRRIRVKQFFNDWWIPTVADISFRSAGRPLVHRHGVAFVGRDYRRHNASCGHRWGTAVELSVETGTLEDAEWTALWSELDALVPGASAAARGSTFAARNYWNRWNRTQAPWDTSEISSLAWSAPTTEAMDRAAWALTADRWAPVPGTIDSLGFRTGPQGEEVQMVFRWPLTLDTSAWLRVLRAAPLSWRSLVDASEVNRPQWSPIEVGGVHAERAAMDPTVGNWYYAWRQGDAAYELHLRAAQGLDAARADGIVRALTEGRTVGT